MVEKEVSGDEESTVMLEAIVSAPETTVGAAIQVLEAKIASKGIELKVPPFARKSEKGKVDGELLRLPMLIYLGITHGIDTVDDANERSIGKLSSYPETSLVPGNIVALYSHHHGCFLRIHGKTADYGGGPRAIDSLPFEWDSERFLVVDAGNENIAFYSPSHRQFLGSKNTYFSSAGYPIVSINESPRANEAFEVLEHQGRNGCFSLRCPIEGAGHRCSRVQHKGGLTFQAVEICGFD